MLIMDSLFNNLESNNSHTVEESKKELAKVFTQTKESWLVYGMMDYFSNNNSERIIDVLVKVQAPHDNYIFDKLLDWINTTKRNQAFYLFWHIVKRHPSWLHKVASHPLFKEILKVLRTENNIITTMNAVFCVIILLPIIPTSMPQYLNDLFETFMYLATWKAKNKPELSSDQLIHLQIGISTLFQFLYGMYPCNFTSYLRERIKENHFAYANVITSLLDTVKMHPLLLTSNRESEKSISRWKEMEPHDVYVECLKYAFENAVKFQTVDCEHNENTWYNQLITDTPSNFQMNNILPMGATQRAKNTQKLDNIWSPSSAVLATPPPTNALTHTPTPTMINPNYTIQTISSGPYTSSGASPPEAAVEATPETTPMKDFVKTHRPYPINSTAARTIWGNSSQPSSPLKKDDSSTSFRYPENTATALLKSTKLHNLFNDRNLSKLKHEKQLPMGESNANNMFHIEIQDPLSINANELNMDSSQEDEEVTEINKFKIAENISEPVNFGDGNLPTTSDHRIRRTFAKFHQTKNIDENSNDSFTSNNRFSHSWPGLTVIIKDPKCQSQQNENNAQLCLINENETTSTSTCTIGTQTTEEISPLYKHITQDMLSEEFNRIKAPGNNAIDTVPMSPQTLLDQYIETSIKKQSTNDLKSRSVELQLLYLQLQYERYRREVHAERNRRLLGKSRDNAALKMDNDKLKYQLERLAKDLIKMTENLNEAKIRQNAETKENFKECERLHNEIQEKQNHNKEFQMEIDLLNHRVSEEIESKKEMSTALEAARADIFDLQNMLRQCQDQADIGAKYKEELQRMQTKEVLMGELQIKLNEKLIELNNLRARDGEIDSIKHSYNEEVKELKTSLSFKSQQLDTTKEQMNLIQSQLQRRDNLIGEQKRNLEIVKEEYEEKLKAVEAKYAAQKAIILRLEEAIFDLYKNKSAVNQNMTIPEADRSDMVGSLDHTSPSSLASSEGLSYSLRSVTEIKNLSQLVHDDSSMSTTLFSQSNGVSTSSNTRPIVSDDIPVPIPSSSHSHYRQ